LFTLGMTGVVSAFDAASVRSSGRSRPPVQPSFHTAMSPIVDGGMMILHVGGNNDGALTAFDPATGAVKWTWTGDGPGYGSPIIADIGGTRQVVVFSQRNLVGVSAADGKLLWSVPFEARSTTNSITPLVYGGNTIIVAGQGKPLTSYIVANKGGNWVADLAWENPQVQMSFSNGVLVGDAIFSMSPLNSGQFFWADAKIGEDAVALRPAPGRQRGDYALGRPDVRAEGLRRTDDRQSDTGVAFTPIKTYTVATSATWAPPVISGNRIFVKDIDTLALWTLN
jgi:outer membrane protein assembly factor BamB